MDGHCVADICHGQTPTHALAADGTKTFAEGETMALVYKNTNNETVVVESEALTTGDIDEGAQSATFTFTLEDPDKTKDVTYIYPAAMANTDGSVNYAALSEQDGTLATLSSTLDVATLTAKWNGDNLPEATLDNQLAILALTLKDDASNDDITSTITTLAINDGTNSYGVNRSPAAGPIYVAIQPTDNADLTITATDGTTNYTKSLTGKTYEASNGYPVTWRMTKMATTYTAPTLRTGSDTYNGSAKTILATEGSATNGTLSYSFRYKTIGGSYGSWSGWSTTAPTGTNAGVYEVKYKVEPAAGYTGGIGYILLQQLTTPLSNLTKQRRTALPPQWTAPPSFPLPTEEQKNKT